MGADPSLRSFTIKWTQKTFICSFHSTVCPFPNHTVSSLCYCGGVLRPDGAPSHEDISVEKDREKQILNEDINNWDIKWKQYEKTKQQTNINRK